MYEVAAKWGMTFEQFDALPPVQQARYLRHYELGQMISAVSAHDAEQERKRNANKRKPSMQR